LTPTAKRALLALAIAAAWTALALLFAVTTSLTYLSTGRPARWALTISMALADWGVWAVLTYPVLWLAGRMPLQRRTAWRNLPLHIVVSAVVAMLKVAADRWIRRHAFGFPVAYFLISNLAPQIVIYWGLVAAAHGWAYYRTSRDRELRASQLEARLAATRLQLLQMQLQPHFLFNTLNTISELVHENPEAADRMIGGLSDLLREALAASSARDVPLARELAMLNQYVAIQTARFGDRLHVVVEAAPAALQARVPSLTLQPLVENAIRHGLGSSAARVRVDVRAMAADNTLTLEVTDDGVGFSRRGDLQEGLGLTNTRARLQELYGSAHSFEIRERHTGGVSVTLTLPLGGGEIV
jgi:two-component system, LytTR family, sensor kinase